MRQIILDALGNFTQTAYVPGLGFLVSYQRGKQAVLSEVEPQPDGTLLAIAIAADDMGGSAGGFPRIHPVPGGYVRAWRRGAPPYNLCTVISGVYQEHQIEVHGSYPVAFGGDWMVFQDTRDYRIRRCRIGEDPRNGQVIGWGRPTGISHADDNGVPVLVDDLKARPPAGVYKSYAGDVTALEADGAAGPEVQLVKADGRIARLWQGQTSVFPWVSTDGTRYFVGTEGSSVRAAFVNDADFVRAVVPPPFGVTAQHKALGYFFGRRSKYGSFPECSENTAVLPLDAWQDGDGSLPANVGDQLRASLREVGRGFISNTAIPHAAPEWALVLGVLAGRQEGNVWVHEPASADEARQLVAETRQQITDAKLATRPVVVILREDRAADPSYLGVADALAPEIYFRNPEATYERQLQVTRARIAEVCDRLAPTPLHLCIQAFDRIAGGPQWRDAPWAMEAIQHAANEAAARDQVRSLWWFAYARPGGVRAYPQLEPWHRAQLSTTTPPPLIVDTKPPENKPPKPPQGGHMTEDDLHRWANEIPDRSDDPNVPSLFGALGRYHDEVLPRDRPGDPVVKSADGGDFNTADVVTGGANGYLIRSIMTEYFCFRSKGQTHNQAWPNAYDKAIASYRKATGQNPQ